MGLALCLEKKSFTVLLRRAHGVCYNLIPSLISQPRGSKGCHDGDIGNQTSLKNTSEFGNATPSLLFVTLLGSSWGRLESRADDPGFVCGAGVSAARYESGVIAVKDESLVFFFFKGEGREGFPHVCRSQTSQFSAPRLCVLLNVSSGCLNVRNHQIRILKNYAMPETFEGSGRTARR